jgi:hypothetical protein
MKVLDPLVVRWTGDMMWFIEKEIRYIPDGEKQITVPAGATTDLSSIPRVLWPVRATTDLSSIPRVLWPVLSPAGTWARASVLHDWTYSQRLFRRKKCDDLFLEAMLDDRVTPSTARLIHSAVRAFGRKAYET